MLNLKILCIPLFSIAKSIRIKAQVLFKKLFYENRNKNTWNFKQHIFVRKIKVVLKAVSKSLSRRCN